MSGEARIGILVGARGRGTNLAALVAAFPSAVAFAAGPSPDAPALERARAAGVPVRLYEGPDDLGGCDLLCLAGYLRLFPPDALDRFPLGVLNIHPSLLPRFGGPGMYGSRVHAAVLAAGEAESGCTVHRVTPVYDEGEIVAQSRCPVLPGDTPETLAARVLALEGPTYVEAVRRVLA